jgi:hypothetical protein
MLPTFYHAGDPDAPRSLWHFVYLHGLAQSQNDARALSRDFNDEAGDLIACSSPMPEHAGEYKASLYGDEVVVVLADRGGWLGGRAALACDAHALAHVRKPKDWR